MKDARMPDEDARSRQVPVLARVGAHPEILEDASDLYYEAATRLLGRLGPPAERLLRHLDNNVQLAAGLLANMLRSRDRWMRSAGTTPSRATLESFLVSERQRLLERARAIHPQASEELARQLLTKDG